MISAEQLRQRTPRRRWRIILASVLALALLVAAKPVYHWVKARRADQLSAEAERLVQQQKFGEAAVNYRAALKLDPFGYRPLRGAALLATRLHHSEALPLWEQVAASPHATAADREECAAALLQAGMFPPAQRIIDELLRQNPSTRALLLASRYSESTGNAARALEYARLAVKRAPADETAQARLAEILAASSQAEERAEAQQILWKLAAGNGAARRAALEALTRAPELSREEETRLLTALHALSPFTVTDALLAADVELRLHPENASAIYDDVIANWARDDPSRGQVAQWLNLHQQSERVLALVPLEPGDTQLLLARLDALATEKRWGEIEEALARPDLAFDASVVEAFRARAALEQHATLDAEFHWDKAISAARDDPQKLRFIASFAEQSGADEAARRALEQLARWPEHALFALAAQQRLAGKNRDVNAARDLAQKALALQSSDPDAQNRVLYYNLLLQKELDASAAKAKELAAKFPNRLEFRVTAALGCLRQHDATGALAQFKGPPIDWSKTQLAWRAIYAAALLANEQTERAAELIKTIPREQLSDDEAALISTKAEPGKSDAVPSPLP